MVRIHIHPPNNGGCYVIAKRKRPKRVSKKFNRMCEVYIHFSKEWKHICDYSDESKMEMFCYETFGDGLPKITNGYYLGKKWMDINVKMWYEEIPDGYTMPTCFKKELYDDPNYPDWWLDKVIY